MTHETQVSNVSQQEFEEAKEREKTVKGLEVHPKIHELKVWPPYFRAVKDGAKPFEIRYDDRGFEVGDKLFLREFSPLGYYKADEAAYYTGRTCIRKISYILRGKEWGLMDGYVVLGLQNI